MALQSVEERLARLEQAEQAATGRARRWQLTAICMLPVALLLGLPHAGVAASQAGGVPGLEQRVTVLEASNTNLANQITALQQALANETTARQSADSAQQSALAAETAARQSADTALQNSLAAQPTALSAETAARIAADASQQSALTAETAARQSGDNALQSQVGAHNTVLSAFSRVGDDLILTGVNLHLRNGLGATASANGLGNLIVGYNEHTFGYPRTGSHNVVVGSENGSESYGGLVAGFKNRSTAQFASVTGGLQNVASGEYASVTGGATSTASGSAASINGGSNNITDGVRSVISGGFGNTTGGQYATITGGAAHIAKRRLLGHQRGTGDRSNEPVRLVRWGCLYARQRRDRRFPRAVSLWVRARVTLARSGCALTYAGSPT